MSNLELGLYFGSNGEVYDVTEDQIYIQEEESFLPLTYPVYFNLDFRMGLLKKIDLENFHDV